MTEHHIDEVGAEVSELQTRVSPAPLTSLDIETIRVASERTYAARLRQHPLFVGLARAVSEDDPKEHRRRLMARSLRLTESMATAAYRVAHDAKRILGIDGDLELYQRSGPENAAMHRVPAPILLEIYGPLLTRLDERTLLGLFGHELGHYLAHGASSPLDPSHAVTAVLGEFNDDALNFTLSRLSMAMELTADRIGLLATQDLTAMLRLEMAVVTGLSSDELTWDTDAYLAQCRELIEAELSDGNTARGSTHPEHNLRAYALWLFSETKTYRELTGRGPGTRSLADVDATIAYCLCDDALGQKQTVDYSRMGEPPQELHECALACAVIVACADGALCDEEREAIERQFATLVPDWQTYLDQDIALERFNETAPIVASAGDDLVRGLFFVLIRVMTVDGEIHPDEVAILLAIGRVLGGETLFRSGLDAVLKTLRLQIDVDATPPTSVPLPARNRDVDEAFKTFLANVVRRGEGTITLRRLLLMLGSEQLSDESVGRIARVFDDHDIQADPALATAGFDDRIALTARAKRALQEPSQPPSPPPLGSRTALSQALRRLRDQLVSGDGRSPSVRLRQLRGGRAFDLALLDKVSVGMAQRVVEQIRARKTVRLVDAADAGRHGAAQNASQDLLALAREDAQRAEETGARDLFAGFPFITGNIDGYTVRAPLVLYPVTLERDGDGARGFRLVPRRDELPIANQSLIRLIFNKRGFAYTDELSDELEAIAGAPDGGPEAVLKKLGDVGLAAKEVIGTLQPFRNRDAELVVRGDGLEIEEVCVIGLFPQSSSDLLQDYDSLLHDLAAPTANVAELLGAASTLLPEQAVSRDAPLPEMPTTDWTPVIPADPSQRSVIAECRRQGATVIDGPPGTGKSQVIVNLVAEALRRGERVAVVCEKRAALAVVQQRLAAIGFGKALGVVHDVYEDRKALYAHIAARLEARERIPFDAAETERVRAEHAEVQSALEQRSAILRQAVPGLDMNVGELFAFVSAESTSGIEPISELDRIPQAKLREVLDLVASLLPLADLWGKASPWRDSKRRSLADLSAAARGQIEQSIERSLAAARLYEELLAKANVPIEPVEAARAALTTAVGVRSHRTDDRARALFGTLANLTPAQAALPAVAQWTYRQASTALTRFDRKVELEPGRELIVALSVLRRWASSWLRVFVFGWWRARSAFRREVMRLMPERAGDAITPALLDEISDRISASRAWKALAEVFGKLGLLLPGTSAQLEPTIDRVASLSEALAPLGEARSALERIGAWIPTNAGAADCVTWDRVIDDRLALLEARDALSTAVVAVEPWSPFPLGPLPSASQLQRLLDLWQRDSARLPEADALLARLTSLLPSATLLLDALSDRLDGATTVAAWRKATSAAWGRAWLTKLEREQPLLARLGHADDDREVERFAARLRELETERCELEIERTLARIDAAKLLNVEPAAKGVRRTPEQKIREELLKEVCKQRQLMPLRTFVRRFAPQGLLDVVPVWLLSPETMAILFPRQALFDLVVFDEASQCTVESGLPVLMRAKRVMIAGDEKQMPPSSYFSLGASEEELPTGSPAEPDGAKEMVKDLLSSESLLSLARPRVSHTGLTWHYRCRDESLIAFSNHAMYAGELLTIPSTSGGAAPSAIHWVPVENGTYTSGENPTEAARVVDVIDELLARPQVPTIGVVTFNLKQRRAILDAIDKRSSADPVFRERWLAATTQGKLDERPFVKNLEQVQGDERDIIVFSLGHAPIERKRNGVATGETYVPARFGPLGQRGGERRLNVAISRARSACYVVASFVPGQLTVASSKNSGPRLFKEFLEFAYLHHHGRKLDAQRVLDRVRERGTHSLGLGGRKMRAPIDGFVPTQTQIALELEAAGIPYELDVGASEFQVPIAVLTPTDPARYALAIQIDDAQGSADPFDHHVHRPGVLRQREWTVLHVTPASWLRRKAEIMAQIESLVPDCRGAIENESYTRHRERQRQALAPAGIATSMLVKSITVAPMAVEFSMAPPSTNVIAEPERGDLPIWTFAIPDELFRKALLHIEKHGSLDEAELTNLVGGPRRARMFASELDSWRAALPFIVEVSNANGIKIYRRGTA
jgi:tellurite resistance protein/RecA/RadA recombinase